MEFGKLQIVDNKSNIELFNIHVVRQNQKQWDVGEEISTFNFPEREYDIERQFLKFDKERRFEIIRKAKYPDYPSRNKCLFAVAHEDLDYWKNKFQNRRGYLIQIAKIQLIDGKWIKLDDTYFEENNGISNEELAEDFWSGNDFMTDAKPVVYLLMIGLF